MTLKIDLLTKQNFKVIYRVIGSGMIFSFFLLLFSSVLNILFCRCYIFFRNVDSRIIYIYIYIYIFCFVTKPEEAPFKDPV